MHAVACLFLCDIRGMCVALIINNLSGAFMLMCLVAAQTYLKVFGGTEKKYFCGREQDKT